MTAIRLRTGVMTDVRYESPVPPVSVRGRRAISGRVAAPLHPTDHQAFRAGARHLPACEEENDMAEEHHGTSKDPAVSGMSRRQFVTHALGIGLSAASTAAFLAGCSGGRQSGRRLRTR